MCNYQMGVRRGLQDCKRWPPGEQLRRPLGLTTQTSALVKNSCREKNRRRLFSNKLCDQLVSKSPIFCCQQFVFLGGPWVLGPQGLGDSCCRICDSVTVTVCQDSPHCHTVLLCSAPECGASLSCQAEELGESGATFPTNDISPLLPTVPKRSPVLDFG